MPRPKGGRASLAPACVDERLSSLHLVRSRDRAHAVIGDRDRRAEHREDLVSHELHHRAALCRDQARHLLPVLVELPGERVRIGLLRDRRVTAYVRHQHGDLERLRFADPAPVPAKAIGKPGRELPAEVDLVRQSLVVEAEAHGGGNGGEQPRLGFRQCAVVDERSERAVRAADQRRLPPAVPARKLHRPAVRIDVQADAGIPERELERWIVERSRCGGTQSLRRRLGADVDHEVADGRPARLAPDDADHEGDRQQDQDGRLRVVERRLDSIRHAHDAGAVAHEIARQHGDECDGGGSERPPLERRSA